MEKIKFSGFDSETGRHVTRVISDIEDRTITENIDLDELEDISEYNGDYQIILANKNDKRVTEIVLTKSTSDEVTVLAFSGMAYVMDSKTGKTVDAIKQL